MNSSLALANSSYFCYSMVFLNSIVLLVISNDVSILTASCVSLVISFTISIGTEPVKDFLVLVAVDRLWRGDVLASI